jgi:restriction system protein
MAVPDYETLMLPVLKFLGDGNDHKTSEIVSHVSNEFDLSEDDREALIPSGRAKLVNNRVGWACTYLRKAGLISSLFCASPSSPKLQRRFPRPRVGNSAIAA